MDKDRSGWQQPASVLSSLLREQQSWAQEESANNTKDNHCNSSSNSRTDTTTQHSVTIFTVYHPDFCPNHSHLSSTAVSQTVYKLGTAHRYTATKTFTPHQNFLCWTSFLSVPPNFFKSLIYQKPLCRKIWQVVLLELYTQISDFRQKLQKWHNWKKDVFLFAMYSLQ